MGANTVITIARQYGSGGREIGQRLAEELGIPVYDRELITLSASNSNLHPEILQQVDEKASSSLLYTLAMGSNTFGMPMAVNYKMPLNDQLFLLQSELES